MIGEPFVYVTVWRTPPSYDRSMVLYDSNVPFDKCGGVIVLVLAWSPTVGALVASGS
jgi:hypothetical protein